MRLKQICIGLSLMVGLAGCQVVDELMGINTSSSSSTSINDVPRQPPPDMQQTPPANTQTASSLVIYLGSMSPLAGYTQVSQKGRTVYVDPRNTLVFTDLRNALAVLDENNRPYVNLEFSRTGAEKLAQITGNNIGKNLIITLNNELISIFNIDARNTTGVLHVPMQSVQDAQTVERRILDGE